MVVRHLDYTHQNNNGHPVVDVPNLKLGYLVCQPLLRAIQIGHLHNTFDKCVGDDLLKIVQW